MLRYDEIEQVKAIVQEEIAKAITKLKAESAVKPALKSAKKEIDKNETV